jgi:hypothetical protein
VNLKKKNPWTRRGECRSRKFIEKERKKGKIFR